MNDVEATWFFVARFPHAVSFDAAVEKLLRELAENPKGMASAMAHAAPGFKETSRIVYERRAALIRKTLDWVKGCEADLRRQCAEAVAREEARGPLRKLAGSIVAPATPPQGSLF